VDSILIRALSELRLQQSSLLLAVSGGADSVALLRGMIAVRSEQKLTLHVAHLNHKLRGAAADEDAAWLNALCGKLQVPATIGETDVAALARESALGIEEAARHARYEFLAQTAAKHKCSHIAVAHTADDQVETVLHHILRGTGLAGLRGMPRQRRLDSGVTLVRPLLDVTRAQVLEYLQTLGQDYREDHTNLDETYTRNRIRRQLLPLLEREFQPDVRQSLLRLAAQAAEAQDAIEALAGALREKVVEGKPTETECRLLWQPLVSQPRHLVRELFALIWKERNWPRQNMSFDQWDRLAEIALAGGAATFPGRIDVRRSGKYVVLTRS
jgi:tRNA(Ile)-lysidine synthase